MIRCKIKETKLSRRKNWTNFFQLSRLDTDIGRKLFVESYTAFMQKSGLKIQRIPIMAKRPLDLYRLFVTVQRLGGFEQVVKHRQWSRVVRELQLPSSITSAAFTLRTQSIDQKAIENVFFANDGKLFDCGIATDATGAKRLEDNLTSCQTVLTTYYKFLYPYEHSQDNILSRISIEETAEKMKNSIASCYRSRGPDMCPPLLPGLEVPRQCCGHPELLQPCIPSYKDSPVILDGNLAYEDKLPFDISVGMKRGQLNMCGRWNDTNLCQEGESFRAPSKGTNNGSLSTGFVSGSSKTFGHGNGMQKKHNSPLREDEDHVRVTRGNDETEETSEIKNTEQINRIDVPTYVYPRCQSRSNQIDTEEGCTFKSNQTPKRSINLQSPKPNVSHVQSDPDVTSSPIKLNHCTHLRSFFFQTTDLDRNPSSGCQREHDRDDVKLYLRQQTDKILLVTVLLNNVPFDGALFAEIEK